MSIEITPDGWGSWKHQRETKYAADRIKQEQTKLLESLAQRHILANEVRFELLGMYEALGFVLDLIKSHELEGKEPTGEQQNESVYRDFDVFINRLAAPRLSSTGTP